MAVILSADVTPQGSADFTLATGDMATLFLMDASDADGLPRDAQVDIQIKSTAGGYYSVGSITYEVPCVLLAAPGTYRVYRRASSSAVGVEKS